MNTQQISQFLASSKIRALAIAVIVLSVLAIMQVHSYNRHQPMCNLLEHSTLEPTDVQRIQIALSQAGLDEYRIEQGNLLIPTSRRAEYLQAVANHDAMPREFDDDSDPPDFNPFLSRSQQLAKDRHTKKKQVREMVGRLPFVKRAWFEMDRADFRSAFEAAEQSAVISVQPTHELGLTNHQVDTVKKMIGGAIAGLDPNDIVVIDLSAGLAHHKDLDPALVLKNRFQRMSDEQRQIYHQQISEALNDYRGVEIKVNVEIKTDEYWSPANQTTEHHRLPEVQQASAISPMMPLAPGANGFASIEDFPSPAPVKPQPAVHVRVPDPQYSKHVSVEILVPEETLYHRFGPPQIAVPKTNRSEYQLALTRDTDEKFAAIRSEMIRIIQPLISDSSYQNQANLPITVKLVRNPVQPSSPWFANVVQFFENNWPSIAVLMIGVILLSLVSRSDSDPHHPEAPTDVEEPITLGIHRADANENLDNAEVRLSRMIEKDPDTAAKVIESWIRDAA